MILIEFRLQFTPVARLYSTIDERRQNASFLAKFPQITKHIVLTSFLQMRIALFKVISFTIKSHMNAFFLTLCLVILCTPLSHFLLTVLLREN